MGLSVLLLKGAGLGLAALLVHYLYSYLFSPIKDLPGPTFAKFTNLWRFFDYLKSNQIVNQIRLHNELGPAIQLGPNMVSLSDPALIKTVYSTRGNFLKSDFYTINDALQDGRIIQNVFGTRSNEFHSKYMRPIQKHFLMNNILAMQHFFDKTILSFCHEIEERFIDGPNAGKVCDMADWIEFFAWDLSAEMTFSQEMGFMKTGADVKNSIATGEAIMHYFGIVGQMPFLDKWQELMVSLKIRKLWGRGWLLRGAIDGTCLKARCRERLKRLHGKVFRSQGIEAKELYPGVVSDNEVVGYLLLNMLAGADTTAITQKAIFYHILKKPKVLAKLRAELDAANLTFPPSYENLQDLPYLNAIVKEGFRIHPPVGGILERIMSSSGLALPDGRILPPGTIVGMNTWVTSRNKEVYGEDVESFRPDRWLRGEKESEDAAAARFKRMKDAELVFGVGSRVCTGRHLATVELLKYTATIFSKYDMELQEDWHIHHWWFVFANNIKVKFSRRAPKGLAN